MKSVIDDPVWKDRCLLPLKIESGDLETWFTRTILKTMTVPGPAITAIDPNRISNQIRENNRQRIS